MQKPRIDNRAEIRAVCETAGLLGEIDFLQVEQKPVKALGAELQARCFVAKFEDVPSVLEGLSEEAN